MNYTVLQFGEGNFIRAFFDWMLQKIGDATGEEHRVFLVQPIDRGRVEEIAAAGEYHVLLRGYQEGEYREILDPVRVVAGGTNPFTPEGLMAMYEAALSPDLRVVTSNTTEAGIFFEERRTPHNYPSLLAAALEKRAAEGLPPLHVVPLELIENNGAVLKECLEKYGKLWNYGPAYFSYLEGCTFYDTLVDRIVTGFPAKEAAEVFRKIGHEDRNVTAGELFHLFVLQGDKSILDVLPFHKAGLNAVITGDRLSFYRDRKVRVLNGVHTASVPVALLAGVEYVKDFVEDPRFAPRLRSLVHDEIVPAFSDDAEAHQYGDDVLERFRNPALEHAFRSIALNSVAKSNTRLRPTLEGYFGKFGELPPILTECIAAMTELYDCDGVKDLPGGPLELSDHRQLRGRSLAEMTDGFFPGLSPDLRAVLLSRLGELRGVK
ncbi:Altronate oxidoreductase [bioreactor metagenome]|uniref:Altronate oxidoreductase n=1 Tax=bioreactor metagenome TaxID=1076179 RepID=A0A644W6T5_9ZZZZ